MASLKFIIPLLNDSDGKDKILRFIQYFTILSSRFHSSNEMLDLAKHYLQVSKTIYDLRRMLRLFKSFSMFPKLQRLFEQYNDIENKYQLMIKCFSHISYAIFYFIDNVAILCRIQFLNFKDKDIEKTGFFIWLIGLLTSLTSNIVKIRYSFKEEAELKTAILNNMTPQTFFNELNRFSRERKNFFFNVVRNVCDSMVALNKLDLPRKILRTNLNPILVALCGMTATIVGIFQMCEKELKPKMEKKEKEIYDMYEKRLDEIPSDLEKKPFKKNLSVNTDLNKQGKF